MFLARIARIARITLTTRIHWMPCGTVDTSRFPTPKAKINLIDLAGSERTSKASRGENIQIPKALCSVYSKFF